MKIKIGIVLAFFAMMGMVLGLSSKALSRGERIGIIIFCSIVIAVGIMIETPLVKNITEKFEVEGDSGKPPEGWKSE